MWFLRRLSGKPAAARPFRPLAAQLSLQPYSSFQSRSRVLVLIFRTQEKRLLLIYRCQGWLLQMFWISARDKSGSCGLQKRRRVTNIMESHIYVELSQHWVNVSQSYLLSLWWFPIIWWVLLMSYVKRQRQNRRKVKDWWTSRSWRRWLRIWSRTMLYMRSVRKD